MPYKSDSHRKHLIRYHIILVVKYRKKLFLNEAIGLCVKELMKKIESTADFTIEEMELDTGHLHLMVMSKPNISPTQIVRKLKQESTIGIWRIFLNELKNHYWNERTFWTDGYFVSSIGEVSAETLKNYIQNQG